MKKPIIVTGCGRSGTHWLGAIMEAVHGVGAGGFEPTEITDLSEVVVDSRIRKRALDLANQGHRVVHLARDGRDVARSIHRFFAGTRSFEACCEEWAAAVDMMANLPVMRLEDLVKPGDPSGEHLIPHWTEWSDERNRIFWSRAARQMEALGYGSSPYE